MRKLKKRIAAAVSAASILFSVAASAAAIGAGRAAYVHTTPLASNLDYVNTVYWNDDFGREESYALRYTPGGDAYPIVIKDDTVYGRVDITSALTYAEQTRGRNILAAANADFFAPSTGIPLGMFIEDGIYKSSTEAENAVVFRADGTAVISEAPKISISLVNNATGGLTAVNHLNKNRYVSGAPYLYSSAFSSVSTRTSGAGWHVRFKIIEGSLLVGGTMTLAVEEKAETDAAAPIGEGYLVLTAGGAADGNYANFNVGDTVTLTVESNDLNLNGALFAAGAGDFIVRSGEVLSEDAWDKELLVRSPKTAFGVTADGEVVIYVVDGRNSTYGNGLTLTALAEQMKALGCVAAVNLDGGGSSVMAVRKPGTAVAAVVNRPSDGEPRKAATYIAFATDNGSVGGTARNLTLANDGAIVLAGSSISLGFAATDNAFRPASAPSNITAVSRGGGEVANIDGENIYTAGTVQGADKLSLYAEGSEAVGTGEVFVLTHPTSLTAADAWGEPLTAVQIAPGGTLPLNPIATFYRKDVVSQPNSFTYTVSEDIGTVSPDGVFTASPRGNRSGTVTVAAGDKTSSFTVTISGFEDVVGHWGYDYINDLYGKGIVNGTSPTTYSPENNITRGDFVLMLHRAVGLPEPLEINAFDDVPANKYYAAAVAWAKEAGITNGVGGNKFAPDEQLTRENAFTFVYRAFNALTITTPEGFAPQLPGSGFADSDDVADYAQTPAAALVALQIVGGADGRIMPKAPLTRAQMAKILSVTLALQGQTIELPAQPETPEIPQETETPQEPETPSSGDDVTPPVEEVPENPIPPEVIAVG